EMGSVAEGQYEECCPEKGATQAGLDGGMLQETDAAKVRQRPAADKRDRGRPQQDQEQQQGVEKRDHPSSPRAGPGAVAQAARCPYTQRLAGRNSAVRTTLCSIVGRGFQPRERIFFVSRKMNGLSPIQPRSPPLYTSRGRSPRCPVIQRIESFTSQYSSVP